MKPIDSTHLERNALASRIAEHSKLIKKTAFMSIILENHRLKDT